jgi:hypothetical protein
VELIAPTKIFEKTFQKPLDKSHKVWYNIRAVGKRKPTDYKPKER